VGFSIFSNKGKLHWQDMAGGTPNSAEKTLTI
jgi:hypothetical protein